MRYSLAAIIDWELAGFYPPSYQLSLQDTYLGDGNRHLSFYLLLKQGMKDTVPLSPSQVALVRAMELMFESQYRWLSDGTNIPAHIRKRFREMLGLTRDKYPYLGTMQLNLAVATKWADVQLEDGTSRTSLFCSASETLCVNSRISGSLPMFELYKRLVM